MILLFKTPSLETLYYKSSVYYNEAVRFHNHRLHPGLRFRSAASREGILPTHIILQFCLVTPRM